MKCKKIGIDKLVLYGFTISYMDIDYLRKLENVSEKTWKNKRKITISDTCYFDLLTIQFTKFDNKELLSVYLSLSVHNSDNTNLIPKSYEEYDNYLSCVLDYISGMYGIELDDRSVKVAKMEINTNIYLKYDYSEYQRVFKLLMSLFPKTYNKEFKVDNHQRGATDTESLYRGNYSIQIVFYNKSQELSDKFENEDDEEEGDEVFENVLRIEFKILKSDKIRRLFGTNEWHMLNNEKIEGCFLKLCHKNIVNPFEKWLSQCVKRAKREYKEGTLKNAKQVVLMLECYRNEECIFHIPRVLDVEQVLDAVAEIPSLKKNLKRLRANVLNHESQIISNIFCNSDLSKAKEIIEAINGA